MFATTVGIVEKKAPFAAPLRMTNTARGPIEMLNGQIRSILIALRRRDRFKVLSAPMPSARAPPPRRPTKDANWKAATRPPSPPSRRRLCQFGRIDMLVNNAGVMDKFDAAGTVSLDIWNRVIGVNLTGAYLCTKAAVNAFEAQSPPGGTIINICSAASTRGLAAGAAYTASKHGLLGLMRNTAGFYGPKGIYSIAFLMGGMDTNIVDVFATGFNQEGMAAMQAANPGFVVGKTNIQLGDVAKYCIFYSDRAIAESSNGTTVTISKNWPAA
ncbi:hypothetical protein NUW58_g9019 [Xylaria curta]|uniref:Uncharacterized protein n=1 Tax=Xylaria curta TaxID=42375 RepID=A0ACC1N2P8_9PEZI|nr:hypothetical protein NUW58_g9019 [Xylaria curta]